MGHGTQINGVQRDITGGVTLVNGVQRKITKGLTLVGGVQREISFGSKMFTVTLTGSGWSLLYGRVGINGVDYARGGNYTIEVSAGTEIVCTVYNIAQKGINAIRLNGVGVASVDSQSGSDAYFTYTHVAGSNLTISCAAEAGAARAMTITTD